MKKWGDRFIPFGVDRSKMGMAGRALMMFEEFANELEDVFPDISNKELFLSHLEGLAHSLLVELAGGSGDET